METARAEFVAGINRVRLYMRHIDSERVLITSLLHDSENHLQSNAAAALGTRMATDLVRREFEYCSIVVSLYGLGEQLFESATSRFVAHQNLLSSRFDDLPAPLRTNHWQLSLNLLTKLEQTRFRDRLTAKSMVESLHASFEGKPRLVPEAFAYHTANIRPSVAAEALGKMGSENFIKRLEMSPRFDVLVAAAPRGNRSEVIKEAIDLLDDLATKRNEAAHGSVLNVLANSALAPYVDASEAFGLALCDELTLLSIRNGAARGMDLGAPIKVVDNRIVCITWPASTIRRGDYLLANTSDSSEPCRAGEILEIQVNNVPTDSVTAPPAVDIGLRVGFHTKQNHQFVHVPRKFVL